MSYTRHAYEDAAEIFKEQVTGIMSEPLSDDERLIALETVNNIAERFGSLFKKNNPKFDLERFFKDSGLGPDFWK